MIRLVDLFSSHLETICRLQARKYVHAHKLPGFCCPFCDMAGPLKWVRGLAKPELSLGCRLKISSRVERRQGQLCSFKWQAAPPGAIARGMEVEGLFAEDLGIMTSSGTGLSRSHSTHYALSTCLIMFVCR